MQRVRKAVMHRVWKSSNKAPLALSCCFFAAPLSFEHPSLSIRRHFRAPTLGHTWSPGVMLVVYRIP